MVLLLFGLGFPYFIYRILSKASITTLQDVFFRAKWSFVFDGYRTPNVSTNTSFRRSVKFTPATALHTNVTSSSTPSNANSSNGSSTPAINNNIVRRHSKLVTFLVEHKSSLVYWEAAILLRKASIVLVATIFNDAVKQIIAFTVVMLIWLVTHARLLPYTSPLFNIIDGLSMFTLIITAILGLLTVGPNITYSTELFGTIIMLLANFGTILLLATVVFKQYTKQLRIKQLLYKFFCNNNKLFINNSTARSSKTSEVVYINNQLAYQASSSSSNSIKQLHIPDNSIIDTTRSMSDHNISNTSTGTILFEHTISSSNLSRPSRKSIVLRNMEPPQAIT